MLLTNFAILGLILITIILDIWVSLSFRRVFKKYNQRLVNNNLTGYEIAMKMLADNNIFDVEVILGTRRLSDAYSHKQKTIILSPDVYHSKSITAQAVACHEVGHAVQFAKAYKPIFIRNMVLPFASVASYLMWFSFIALILCYFSLHISIHLFFILLGVTITSLTIIAIFQIATLPLEFDASKRALSYLKSSNLLTTTEQKGAKLILKKAALTYVVALITTILTIVIYVLRFLRLSQITRF